MTFRMTVHEDELFYNLLYVAVLTNLIITLLFSKFYPFYTTFDMSALCKAVTNGNKSILFFRMLSL